MSTPFNRNIYVAFAGDGKFEVCHGDGTTKTETPVFQNGRVKLGCTEVTVESLQQLLAMAEENEKNSLLPEYQCHKVVRAAQIIEIDGNKLVLGISQGMEGMPFAVATTRVVDAKMFARYTPVPGDFFVVYENGYESISPRKAFLDGYARVE